MFVCLQWTDCVVCAGQENKFMKRWPAVDERLQRSPCSVSGLLSISDRQEETAASLHHHQARVLLDNHPPLSVSSLKC